MYASRQARGYDRNVVCDGPRLSLVADSSWNLLFAAAGGRLTRRCSQVPVLVLAYDVGRLGQECTGLRARFTRQGYSVADRCCPGHNLTRALVRKARSQECRKEQRTRDVRPFVITNVHAPRHIRVLRSRDAMSSQQRTFPRLSQNSRQFHDLGVFRQKRQDRSCAQNGRPSMQVLRP